MKALRKLLLAAAILASPVFFSAKAHALGMDTTAVQLGVGTEGIGVTVTTALVPQTLNLNVGYSHFDYGTSFNASGGHFKANASLGAVPIVLSWYPLHNAFHVDGGLYINLNSAKATGTPYGGNTYVINNVAYSAAQVGSLTGKTHFNTVAPYIGVGLGNPVSAGSPWSVNFNAGAMYEGTPSVRLTATGAAANPALAANVRAAQNSVNSKLHSLDLWPIISVGVSYRF